MIITMIIIRIMMMIMPTVTVVKNTVATGKDFRENVSRPNQISLLPPAKRHLRLNLDTK